MKLSRMKRLASVSALGVRAPERVRELSNFRGLLQAVKPTLVRNTLDSLRRESDQFR